MRSPRLFRPLAGPRAILTAALVAAAVGASLIAVVLVPTASAAATNPRQAAANSAASFISARHERGAVAVYDRQTGEYIAAGDSQGLFASASVVKVFIATRLLVEGKMTGATAATAYQMITRSDDNAADQLYGRVGGDALAAWIQARYKIPVGRPTDPGWWGETRISAQGLVLFYARAAADPKVGAWLMNAMAHYTCTAADGWPQCFGIPSAAGGADIKQGWMCCLQNVTRMHSTGYVGHGRYTVAILTEGPTRYYGGWGRDTVTGAAQRLMPKGILPSMTDPHLPGGRFDRASAVGSTVSLTGWAADRDAPKTSIPVDVYESSARGLHGIGRFATTVNRPDVTRSTGFAGPHGFGVRFAAADGTHRYCLYAINVGAGGNASLGCQTVTVRGAPVGHFDGVTAHAGTSYGGSATVTVAGWTFDPDTPSAAIQVAVHDGSTQVAAPIANGPRPDVNRVRKVAGAHGFSVTVKAAPGRHQYCGYAMNVGPPAHNSLLGCATVSVP